MAYKNSYMHANVGMDMFESHVSAATVLQYVRPLLILFVFVELIDSVHFRLHRYE